MTAIALREVRCSDLSRIAVCSASADAPQVKMEFADDSGPLGTAFHAAIADWIRGVRDKDVPDYCRRFNVDPEDLWPLVGIGRRAWDEQLRHAFPNPLVEEEMRFEDAANCIALTGHPDLMAFADGEIRIPDWHTGWRERDKAQQLRGYARLGFERFPEATHARMTTVRIRSQRADTALVWSRAEIFEWWDRLAKSLKRPQFVTSDECGFCPKAMECEAHRREVAFALGITIVGEAPEFGPVDPVALAHTEVSLRTAENTIKRLRKAIKAEVQANGGKLGQLEIVTQDRRSIVAERGWDVLVKSIGLPKLKEIAKIGIGDVGEAAKETAPRGMKGKAAEAIMEKLEEAGAVVTSTVERLEVRKKVEAIADGQ